MQSQNSIVPPQPISKPEVHWPSVIQFGLSVIAILGLWSVSLTFGLVGLVQAFGQTNQEEGVLPFFIIATTSAVMGVLLLPSVGYSVLHLLGRETTRPLPWPRWLRPTSLILLVPLVLWAGNWIARREVLSWFLLPPLHVLAVGIPLLWVVFLGVRGLPQGSPQRVWGVFGSGLIIAPAMIMVIEIVMLVFGVLLWSLWATTQPEIMKEMSRLIESLDQVRTSPEMVVELIGPYLTRPAVMFSVFAFGAVFVPLVEEVFKPIGAWLLIGRLLTPAEGFVAGIISGAGYALVESMAISASGEAWAGLAFARMGTGVVHVLTSGLTGWALVSAWRENRYLRLGVIYLLSVLIHGLWNGLTLLLVFVELPPIVGQPPIGALEGWGRLAPYGLTSLVILCFATLLWMNRRLRHSQSEGCTAEAIV